jgi:hypothetical protein
VRPPKVISELDKEAGRILGVTTENISKEDLEYLQKRQQELEGGEDVLVQEVLTCEYNIKRIRQLQQTQHNAMGSTEDEIALTEKKLKKLSNDFDDFMGRYNNAMESLGVRKKLTKDVQASPLSELWLRYQKAIQNKDRRGDEVGSPSQEALELADKKAHDMGLPKSDYRIKGAKSQDERQRAMDDVKYPTNMDEKKNLISLGVMMDDFLHDPVLAASCILGEILLPEPDAPFTPVQELRIFGLWNHKFMIDSSGFGTGKTFCSAVVSAMRSILMADRHIGILSDTFAQGKLFFTDYFDVWAKRCPIFAAQIELSTKGGFHVIHNDDGFVMHFKNNSEIKTLPPNFMRDANRLKSESWTDFIGDEWTAWMNLGKAQHIIKGRVRRPIRHPYDEFNPIFEHHQAFIGAADYTWRACYEMVQQYEKRIQAGSKKHCLQSWNYLDFTQKWRQTKYGIDEENIQEMMMQMTRDEADRLVFARWMNDSTGFYLASEIAACRE